MLAKARKFFKISICCIFLSSLQIALIPFVSYGQSVKQNIISYAISSSLWGFLIAGYIFLSKTQYYCRIAQRRSGLGRLRRYRLNVGLLNLNTSLEADIFDGLAIISLVATILISIFWNEIKFAVSISAALFVFTFQMRCILNGRIYIDLKTLEARRSNNE